MLSIRRNHVDAAADPCRDARSRPSTQAKLGRRNLEDPRPVTFILDPENLDPENLKL
jgi:hypothetical protein